jgi:hypothetical protein
MMVTANLRTHCYRYNEGSIFVYIFVYIYIFINSHNIVIYQTNCCNLAPTRLADPYFIH